VRTGCKLQRAALLQLVLQVVLRGFYFAWQHTRESPVAWWLWIF
jgi:hypothetical protein